MDDMMFYNKHYIAVDERNRIVDGFSDAFRQPSETDICINEEGGYQFRMQYSYQDSFTKETVSKLSEENPVLFETYTVIPLYKYEGGEIVRRTEEEIEADRPEPQPEPEPEPSDESSVWDELDAAYMEGVDSI